jgi:hypothetical protein
MSGGKFSYAQSRLSDITVEIEEIIKQNSVPNQCGFSHNFSEETLKEFRKGIELLHRAYVYAQRIDWLVSGDDSEPTFHERLRRDLLELENGR